MMEGKSATATSLERVNRLVAAAGEALSAGLDVDMKPIEESVATICEAVAKRPREQSDSVRQGLISLAAVLDTLAAEIRTRYEDVRRSLESQAAAQKASAAYGANPDGK